MTLTHLKPRRALLAATALTSLQLMLAGLPAAACAQASAAAPASAPASSAEGPHVRLVTSAGDIVLALDAAKAPKTVQNFVTYVKAGQYNGTIFHRVIDGFMIQGGGFTPEMVQKATRAPIRNESRNGLSNLRGTIAMARTGDPDSATAQFFINVADNQRLDAGMTPDGNGYTVFGQVVSGLDVVDKIRQTATTNRSGMANVPVHPILIKKATLEPTK